MEQLGEMLRQVQKVMIRGVCEKMKAIERQPEPIWRFEYEPMPGYTPPYQQTRSRHPQRNPNALQGRDAKRIFKAKQALRKAQINVAISCSISTPYASKSLGAEWYEEQEKSSRLLTRKQEAPRKEFFYRLGPTLTGTRNILKEIKGNPMLRRPRPIETPEKFKNKNKYCEYHEDYWHTTSECRELKRALHEGVSGDHNHRDPEGKKDNDADCNTKIIATIIGGIDDRKLNAEYRKTQIWKPSYGNQRVRTAHGTNHDKWSGGHTSLANPHNEDLVIQLKIATAMVRRILVDIESSVDIIALECLKKLQYNEKDLETVELWGSGDKPLSHNDLSDSATMKPSRRAFDSGAAMSSIVPRWPFPFGYNEAK
ncbi:LOW QUALITY PROTEIN: hypothetical protein Cgig2_001187 [Carnegiea gigantea]|uniref:Uncharacterized protein n=1 Tax=Carnegiea gigantea TaxID=171969 RepID=A0A9Q1K0K6_9CARY|nr:LOW QUALITY PROTEIN: hypothetical protein Cgig2_001187 [Carnegiea gigantea]